MTGGSAEAVEPEALVATHWFDSGEKGEPYSATYSAPIAATRPSPAPPLGWCAGR